MSTSTWQRAAAALTVSRVVILAGQTHGEPSQTNVHPHVSGNCNRSGSGAVESEVIGIHNGIIENYIELKEKSTCPVWKLHRKKSRILSEAISLPAVRHGTLGWQHNMC